MSRLINRLDKDKAFMIAILKLFGSFNYHPPTMFKDVQVLIRMYF